MKKKLTSLVLAVLLVCAMSISASAATISNSGTYNGFLYMTTDSCYTDRYYCVIEADSAEYTIATDVIWYAYDEIGQRHIAIATDPGSPARRVSTNSGSSNSFAISRIRCGYMVGGIEVGHGVIPAG